MEIRLNLLSEMVYTSCKICYCWFNLGCGTGKILHRRGPCDVVGLYVTFRTPFVAFKDKLLPSYVMDLDPPILRNINRCQHSFAAYPLNDVPCDSCLAKIQYVLHTGYTLDLFICAVLLSSLNRGRVEESSSDGGKVWCSRIMKIFQSIYKCLPVRAVSFPPSRTLPSHPQSPFSIPLSLSSCEVPFSFRPSAPHQTHPLFLFLPLSFPLFLSIIY